MQAARSWSAASARNVGRRMLILADFRDLVVTGDAERESGERRKPLAVEYRCGIRRRTVS